MSTQHDEIRIRELEASTSMVTNQLLYAPYVTDDGALYTPYTPYHADTSKHISRSLTALSFAFQVAAKHVPIALRPADAPNDAQYWYVVNMDISLKDFVYHANYTLQITSVGVYSCTDRVVSSLMRVRTWRVKQRTLTRVRLWLACINALEYRNSLVCNPADRIVSIHDRRYALDVLHMEQFEAHVFTMKEDVDRARDAWQAYIREGGIAIDLPDMITTLSAQIDLLRRLRDELIAAAEADADQLERMYVEAVTYTRAAVQTILTDNRDIELDVYLPA